MKKEDLYWHFRVCWRVYLLVICVFLIVLFAVWGEYKQAEVRHDEMKVVKEWPLVEAIILEEKISAIDSGSPHVPGVSYFVTLEVEYLFEDRLIRSKVRGKWGHRDSVKAKMVFLRGKEVPLRVNPENPKEASLIEVTGNL